MDPIIVKRENITISRWPFYPLALNPSERQLARLKLKKNIHKPKTRMPTTNSWRRIIGMNIVFSRPSLSPISFKTDVKIELRDQNFNRRETRLTVNLMKVAFSRSSRFLISPSCCAPSMKTAREITFKRLWDISSSSNPFCNMVRIFKRSESHVTL